jgi:hypothetical protein
LFAPDKCKIPEDIDRTLPIDSIDVASVHTLLCAYDVFLPQQPDWEGQEWRREQCYRVRADLPRYIFLFPGGVDASFCYYALVMDDEGLAAGEAV